jgi:hypothetical protein
MRRTAQIVRHPHRLLDRTVEIGRDGNGDEGQSDGEQYLVEIACPIKPAIEHALEHDAHQRGPEKRERQRRKERPLEIVHQRDGDIAAEHRESAVREIDEIHHPEGHGQPDRQQEQQHAVGKAVEQDADHGADFDKTKLGAMMSRRSSSPARPRESGDPGQGTGFPLTRE